jgi:hypothetical protein
MRSPRTNYSPEVALSQGLLHHAFFSSIREAHLLSFSARYGTNLPALIGLSGSVHTCDEQNRFLIAAGD